MKRGPPSEGAPSPGTAAAEFQDVLEVLQQYLSDLVPPLMLAAEGEILLRVPSSLLSTEIERWVAAQYRSGENAPASDYLYHVARKIHQIADLQIFPEEAFLPFQQKLTRILVELCPAPDRGRLIVDLEQLGKGGNIEGAPVHVEHRGGQRAAAAAGGAAPGAAPAAPPMNGAAGSRPLTIEHVQRLELLLQRLERAGAAAPVGEAPAQRATVQGQAPVVAETVISAAEAAGDAKQLQDFLATFRIPGLPSSPAELLAVLAQRLPDWAPPPSVPDDNSPRTVEALRKVVATAGSPGEASKRFQQLVEMATTEFNRGSLGRAVTLLDLARRMVERNEVGRSSTAHIMGRGRELLDPERLKAYAKAEETHALLRRAMAFFSDLSPEALLDQLEAEDQREQRRAILSLVKVHGPDARSRVIERLEESIAAGGTLSWFFERNLILLLRDIPPAGEEDLDRQIDILIWLARPGGPLPSVRDALSALGAIRHKRSEGALTAAISDLERALSGELELPYDRDEIEGLLDRAVGALAAMPSRDARRRVVRHALDRRAQSLQTIERLAPLGQHDLSEDTELVQFLLDALQNELPMKVFGRAVLTPRRSAAITAIIHALAGTDLAEVRKLLSEVARRFPKEAFSSEAERILAGLGTRGRTETERSATMSGDLALLSFPNLLQNIADANLTGTLTLFDEEGRSTSALTFVEGNVATARAGHLEGKTAFFQTLQAPSAARFVFTRTAPPGKEQASHDAQPVLPLLLEGMRRLDELRRSEAIVPADASFRATSKAHSPVPDEQDEALMEKVWEAAAAGRPPAACEAELPADSYRIRRMYEHWLQEGALVPSPD